MTSAVNKPFNTQPTPSRTPPAAPQKKTGFAPVKVVANKPQTGSIFTTAGNGVVSAMKGTFEAARCLLVASAVATLATITLVGVGTYYDSAEGTQYTYDVLNAVGSALGKPLYRFSNGYGRALPNGQGVFWGWGKSLWMGPEMLADSLSGYATDLVPLGFKKVITLSVGTASFAVQSVAAEVQKAWAAIAPFQAADSSWF
jgi:hypothetical protein